MEASPRRGRLIRDQVWRPSRRLENDGVSAGRRNAEAFRRRIARPSSPSGTERDKESNGSLNPWQFGAALCHRHELDNPLKKNQCYISVITAADSLRYQGIIRMSSTPLGTVVTLLIRRPGWTCRDSSATTCWCHSHSRSPSRTYDPNHHSHRDGLNLWELTVSFTRGSAKKTQTLKPRAERANAHDYPPVESAETHICDGWRSRYLDCPFNIKAHGTNFFPWRAKWDGSISEQYRASTNMPSQGNSIRVAPMTSGAVALPRGEETVYRNFEDVIRI
ncbi:hypothetical protein HD554DRAFT_2036465 [Boletus coccyginus]|nr:hypothetical protein HD554DRAFT_2036465 [Boletus coccyginus]